MCDERPNTVRYSFKSKYLLKASQSAGTVVCVYQGTHNDAFYSSELLIYLLAAYLCYSLGHMRKNICGLPSESIQCL